jgi:Reverse transcriptase (RNA-dependent DNA polymerase).
MQFVNDILELSKENKAALQRYARNSYAPGFSDKYKLNALALLSIDSLAGLCVFLDTPRRELARLVNTPEYYHYAIKKKRGGERHIFEPEWQLKRIQRRLNYFLQAYYLWIKPSEVHGFVINPDYLGRRCNIVENAAVHTGRKHVLNIDLKDFFPNISARWVHNLFMSPYFNYPEPLATALTLLTTYRAQLPTGAPTSPVLSNFICLELDAALCIFCRDNRLLFTRYADDLTFSSDTFITEEMIGSIRGLIRVHGFEMNEKKLRIRISNRKQTVTGLTVNEKVNIDRRLLKKIRAMLHDLNANGLEVAARRHFNLKEDASPLQQSHFILRLEGYINFVGQVRGKHDPAYQRFQNARMKV